jgi:ribonuclease BN (tRNA processing enzyme)
MDECYAYTIFDRTDRKFILYTGDTEPFGSLQMLADDADLVIAEGTWASDYTGPAYGHSWAKEMIEAVDESSATKLVLTHLSQKYHSEAGYRIYSSDVMDAFNKCQNLKRIYIAYDGLEITL